MNLELGSGFRFNSIIAENLGGVEFLDTPECVTEMKKKKK